MDDLSAYRLARSITGSLPESKVNLNMCVFQTYDGASIMKEQRGGVQENIKELCRQGVY